MNKLHIITAVAAFAYLTNLSSVRAADAEKTVASPDGKISLVFDVTDGAPTYSANFEKRPVILPSALGFELKDGEMKSGFKLMSAKTSSKDETWTQPWGERQNIRNHYNELVVTWFARMPRIFAEMHPPPDADKFARFNP